MLLVAGSPGLSDLIWIAQEIRGLIISLSADLTMPLRDCNRFSFQ
jgi:hypothetical protein